MKKLVIIHHVSNVGGGTISLVDVCDMLHNDYEVTVVLPQDKSGALSTMLKPFAKVRYYDGVMPQIAHYMGADRIISRGFFHSFAVKRSVIANIVKIIKDETPDVILANSLIQCRMGKYLKNLNAKKYIYIRETFKNTPLTKFMIGMINKYFDGVLCIAPYEKDYAKFKIPCMVAGDCFVERKSNKQSDFPQYQGFKVLFLGGMAPIKGMDVLMKSYRHLKSTDVHFVIAGNVNYTSHSIKNKLLHPGLIKRENIIKSVIEDNSDNIHIVGFVDDVKRLIEQCDVVVFPSVVAHQPRPAIEAGMLYKPVIISDYPQTEFYFKDRVNCLTFKPGNFCDLARKIDILAEDKSLCCELGNKNHEYYHLYHDFETEKNKILKFI